MDHQTLYRKYRPQTLDTVRGQESVVTLFKNVLRDDKLSHAYIFFGARGTGKTSVARIIARELGTTDTDTYEIDAASNRGIDDIRILRDGVNTLPFDSKYKIYIIDEAHMLTTPAANALLKTLEEPPAHCIFILATTDPEKLPKTILSRCQKIEFKKADTLTLVEMIEDVAKLEGYTLKENVAEHIALLGDGSYRDTYGALERIFTLSADKTITEDIFVTHNKKTITEGVLSILENVVTNDTQTLLSNVIELENSSIQANVILKNIIAYARHAIMLRFDAVGEYRSNLQNEIPDQATIERLIKIGKETKNPLTANTLVKLIEGYNTLLVTSFGEHILLQAILFGLVSNTHEAKTN